MLNVNYKKRYISRVSEIGHHIKSTSKASLFRAFMSVSLLTLGLSFNVASHAQQWPAKPVHIIVPFPAGQGADIITRLISERLSPALGQPVIVENRPGAGSMLGSRYVAHAEPDGYTLLAAGSSALAINQHLYSKMSYNPATDFDPISQLVSIEYVLCVSPTLNVKTLPDLISLAKEKPNQVTYGSSGNGSTNHLVMAELASVEHLKLMHIPYKGSSASMTDLLGGQIGTLVESVAVISPYLKSDKMRVLGVTGIKRSKLLPEVPTLDEQGVTGFDLGTWTGLVAPAGTPVAILDRLNAEVGKILQAPDVRQKIEDLGMIPVGGSREQFRAYVASQSQKWGKVVKSSGTHFD